MTENWKEMSERHKHERSKILGREASIVIDLISPKVPDLHDIVDNLSESSGVPVKEIMGKSRKAKIVMVRMTAYWMARSAGVSYPKIGKFFRRDHTTILGGCRKIERLISEAGQ